MLHVVAVVVEVVVVAVEATMVELLIVRARRTSRQKPQVCNNHGGVHKANGQLGQSLRQHEDHWQTPNVVGNQGARTFEDVREWNAPVQTSPCRHLRGARTLLHTCLPLPYGARGHYYIHVYLYNDIMIINYTRRGDDVHVGGNAAIRISRQTMGCSSSPCRRMLL